MTADIFGTTLSLRRHDREERKDHGKEEQIQEAPEG